MKTITVKSPYVPLEVTVEDKTFKTVMDLSVDGLLDLAEECKKAAKKMEALEVLREKAKKGKDPKKIRELNAEVAKVMEAPIVRAIGQEDYDAIVNLCGFGKKIKKEDCNIVFAQVFSVINETVNERREDSMNEKAAHYLAEVEDAQSEPVPED